MHTQTSGNMKWERVKKRVQEVGLPLSLEFLKGVVKAIGYYLTRHWLH